MKTDLRPRTSERPSPQTTTLQPARPAPPDAPETAPIHQTISPEQALHATQLPRAAAAAPPQHKPTPAEFKTAMLHIDRGEVTRANTWRNRLDTTTNWAVVTTGATLSFAFSLPTNPHFVILINTILVGFFLFMEARRYRYYEIWSGRVRVMETGFFMQMLSPDTSGDDKWAQLLVADLQEPRFNVSEAEALGRRLRRNYLWMFMLLAASWNLKVYMHPFETHTLNDFIRKAEIGVVPGEVVILTGIFFNVGLALFAFFTMRLREAKGEVLTERDFHPFQRVGEWTRAAAAATTKRRTATVRRAKRARVRARRTASSASASTTGEWRRADIHRSQPPEDIHRTQFPNRDTVIK